jgi:hypothetical protein
VLFFCQLMGFERNIQLTDGPETILESLALRNGLDGIFLSGQKQGADHGGDGHIAAGGGEAGVLVELVRNLDGDVGHSGSYEMNKEKKKARFRDGIGPFLLLIMSVSENPLIM